MNARLENPYVGPRSFRREEGAKFFGREHEARDLLSLVISEQLVLFYAQSGAGKSSLINTCLVPNLEEKGFEVLPVVRVSSAFMESGNVDNIYILNLALSLDQSKRDPLRFSNIKLPDFLNNLANDGRHFYYAARSVESVAGSGDSTALKVLPRALIIDQFEEIITTHPEAWQKRDDFFRQLADAMRADPYLWVVLVMREDYVAALDPYAHLLPGQLRARYYMRRMGVQAAHDAIRKPVDMVRPFEAGVPELLVDNMRLISTTKIAGQADQPVFGEFVEPVQLQVVCYQLWERIQQSQRINKQSQRITKNDLLSIAKGESIAQFISNALGDFYEQALAKVINNPAAKVQERDLRDWFSHRLITEAETRGFVYRGAESTAGLSNAAVDVLASQYIIRSESRAGGVWIELVHDRFVGPILHANRRWIQQHQNSVLKDATSWKNAKKDDSYLYDGKQLETSLSELETYPDRFAPLEKEFLRASQRSAARRRRRFFWALGTATGVFILILAGLLVSNIYIARQNAALAQSEAVKAQEVVFQVTVAGAARATAEAQSANAINLATSLAGNSDLLQAVISTQDVQIATLQAVVLPNTTPTAEGTKTTTGIFSEEVIGYSANNLEIRVFKFGNGSRHVVLIGGLHAGFAPSSTKMAQELKNFLTNNPETIPSNLTVDVITVANPDSLPPPGRDFAGMLEGRLNGKKVDLNRNWGCDWKADAVWRSTPISGGTAPFSEPETIALRDFFTSSNKLTVAVVLWEARDIKPSVSPGGCGDFSVYSDPLSRLYADAAGYNAQAFVAYAINGDITNWLDSQGIGAVSVLLPDYTDLSPNDVNANIDAVKQILRIYGR